MKTKEDQPLRDIVFASLREKILHGDLQPGTHLGEIALAAEYGVSRTPLREAIRLLEQEGLVNIYPGRGAEVASITEKNVHDVLEVRCALEQLAAERAVERITAQGKADLRRAEAVFRNSINSPDLSLIADRDEAMHDVIFTATGNQVLQKLIGNLREQMYRYRLEYIKDETTRNCLVEEHHSLCDAILRGDKEAARQAAGVHIRNQERTILKNLAVKENHG
ncbi:MAG: GntR family transcriptional regulator [Lachnospiraceae bacterium]